MRLWKIRSVRHAKNGHDEIRTFYTASMQTGAKLELQGPVRVGADYAAFPFPVHLNWEGKTSTVDVIDTFRFNAEGKVTKMRAFFGPTNFAQPVNFRRISMRDAAIVSTARTAVGKAYRGAFNDTEAPVLSAHVVNAALDRAGIDPARVDDVYLGTGSHWNTQSYNFGRLTAIASKLPIEVAGFTLDRKCSSGLNAIALAARAISSDEVDVAVAGGRGNHLADDGQACAQGKERSADRSPG